MHSEWHHRPALLTFSWGYSVIVRIIIWDVLRDLVPFVQFKKREKHSWSRVAFFLHGYFSRFLNCTNGTKSCKARIFKNKSDVSSTCFKQTIKTLLLTLPVLCISKSCNKKNLNFHFDTLTWLKRFYAFKA